MLDVSLERGEQAETELSRLNYYLKLCNLIHKKGHINHNSHYITNVTNYVNLFHQHKIEGTN